MPVMGQSAFNNKKKSNASAFMNPIFSQGTGSIHSLVSVFVSAHLSIGPLKPGMNDFLYVPLNVSMWAFAKLVMDL